MWQFQYQGWSIVRWGWRLRRSGRLHQPYSNTWAQSSVVHGFLNIARPRQVAVADGRRYEVGGVYTFYTTAARVRESAIAASLQRTDSFVFCLLLLFPIPLLLLCLLLLLVLQPPQPAHLPHQKRLKQGPSEPSEVSKTNSKTGMLVLCVG